MNIRQFTLINGNGVELDLNSSSHLFYDISGLGFTDDSDLVQIGYNYAVLDKKYKELTPSGKLFFASPNAYENYHDFINFSLVLPLTLVYETDAGAFKLNVIIKSLAKADLEEGKIGLVCAIKFAGLGKWYQTKTVYNSGSVVDGKMYPYEYPYDYTDDIAMTLSLTSASQSESPCKISIYGPAENPTWKHYVNNELKETGAYNGTISEGYKLVIDTTQIPYTIQELDLANTLVADRYNLCDFSTERFIFLNYGKNVISITSENSSVAPVALEANISYESV